MPLGINFLFCAGVNQEHLNDYDSFAGVLAGNRNTDGTFNNRGTNTNLWSSSESGTNAWNHNLNSGNSTVNRNTNDKTNGFSVRYVKAGLGESSVSNS